MKIETHNFSSSNINFTSLNDLQNLINERKYDVAILKINELNLTFSNKSEEKEFFEMKVICLIEIGKWKEAFELEDKLPSQSLIKNKIKKLKEIIFNKPLNDKEGIKLNNFMNFLHENGVKHPKVDVAFFSKDYRGMMAISTIFKGEEIIVIPEKMLIRSKKWGNSKLNIQMKKELLNFCKENKLTNEYSFNLLLYNFLEEFYDHDSFF